MPVEIRELVIKTTIASQPTPKFMSQDKKSLHELKQQIVRDCLRELKGTPERDGFSR